MISELNKELQFNRLLRDRGESLGEQDERTLVDLLVEQIEFANVILLNKIDLISEKQLKTVKAIIRGLNAKAKIIETKLSKVDLKEVMDTNLYNLEEGPGSPSLGPENLTTLSNMCQKPRSMELSVLFTGRGSFDPKKIHSFFTQEWPGVVRAKGFSGFLLDRIL